MHGDDVSRCLAAVLAHQDGMDYVAYREVLLQQRQGEAFVNMKGRFQIESVRCFMSFFDSIRRQAEFVFDARPGVSFKDSTLAMSLPEA